MNLRREGNEHVKAVTLRSGRELAIPGQQPAIREAKLKEKDQMQGEQPQDTRAVNDNKVRKET